MERLVKEMSRAAVINSILKFDEWAEDYSQCSNSELEELFFKKENFKVKIYNYVAPEALEMTRSTAIEILSKLEENLDQYSNLDLLELLSSHFPNKVKIGKLIVKDDNDQFENGPISVGVFNYLGARFEEIRNRPWPDANTDFENLDSFKCDGYE
jgi:hypothetical protein